MTWGTAPDWAADPATFAFFCSEHPTAPFHELSNWHNTNYLGGPYEWAGNRYWCSEQDLMINKLTYCGNTALAEEMKAKILACQPVPVIAIGETGWEDVWEANHELASNIKMFCRNEDLRLDGARWDRDKGRIMYEVCLRKFALPGYAKALAGTSDRVIVEAAHYDRIFGIGLQEGTHVPRNKPNLGHKSVLRLDPQTGDAVWNIPPGPEWGDNLLGAALMRVRGTAL